jgi:hypothetical protein
VPENGSNEEYDMRDYDSVVKKMVAVYESPEVKGAFEVVDEVVQHFWKKADTHEEKS